jgi:hypothetical protein
MSATLRVWSIRVLHRQLKFLNMARAWVLLARQAEKNSETEIAEP